uniref:Uncharacterized protein n=1 Tax=Romanomermis culicivorax TaxID=13658 RepID=A0A915IH22_ROMCU
MVNFGNVNPNSKICKPVLDY